MGAGCLRCNMALTAANTRGYSRWRGGERLALPFCTFCFPWAERAPAGFTFLVRAAAAIDAQHAPGDV